MTCGVCVCVCVCVFQCVHGAYLVVHANLKGGAPGGVQHRDPCHHCCRLGAGGGFLGLAVGQTGVGLIMACLLETMTYLDVLW